MQSMDGGGEPSRPAPVLRRVDLVRFLVDSKSGPPEAPARPGLRLAGAYFFFGM
jgi:hypothetical protein